MSAIDKRSFAAKTREYDAAVNTAAPEEEIRSRRVIFGSVLIRASEPKENLKKPTMSSRIHRVHKSLMTGRFLKVVFRLRCLNDSERSLSAQHGTIYVRHFRAGGHLSQLSYNRLSRAG